MAVDISVLTRDMFMRTIAEQTFYTSPILAAMFENNRMNWEGGENIEFPVNTDNQAGVDLVQAYPDGDTPLTNGVRYPHAKATVPYAKWQIPIEYDVDEYLANVEGGNESKLIDIVKTRVANSHEWHNQYLIDRLYKTTSTEADAHINSVVLACSHDRTYEGITTDISSSANTYWQGASIAGSYADSATDYGYTIDTIRRAWDTIAKYRRDNQIRPLCIVPTSAFRKLRREAESKALLSGMGGLAKYGFSSMMIDEKVEVTADKWLENESRTSDFFMLDVNTWEMRMHKDRNLKMLDFEYQGNKPGGLDKWTSRIMCMGQLLCKQPNANLYLSNLS